MSLDPIAAILFHVLNERDSVAEDHLCPWDAGHAAFIMAQARMYQYAPGLWTTTRETAHWMDSTFSAMREHRAFVPMEGIG